MWCYLPPPPTPPQPPNPPEKMTDTYENITFPQLLWRVVTRKPNMTLHRVVTWLLIRWQWRDICCIVKPKSLKFYLESHVIFYFNRWKHWKLSNIVRFHPKYFPFKEQSGLQQLCQQKCIPVGCVPPALYRGVGGGGLCTTRSLPWCGGGVSVQEGVSVQRGGGFLSRRPSPPHVHRMTDRCKHITLPQPSLKSVEIMPIWNTVHNKYCYSKFFQNNGDFLKKICVMYWTKNFMLSKAFHCCGWNIVWNFTKSE